MMFSLVSSCPPDLSQARAYVSSHFDEFVVSRSLADAYHGILNAEFSKS